jgi:hypothetical protein
MLLIVLAVAVAVAVAVLALFTGKQNFQNNDRKDQLRKRLIRGGNDNLDEKCSFDPRMVQSGFYSELACKDHCRSVDYREKWGGEYCNSAACESICSQCDDTSLCRWNKAVYKTPDEKIPSPIKLEYEIENENLKLIWEKPKSEYNITAYSCIISDTDNDDEFEVDLPSDLECDFCDHLIRNLENGKVYTITIFARNKYGYSRASNTIRVNMEYEAEPLPDPSSPDSEPDSAPSFRTSAMNNIISIFRNQFIPGVTTRTPDDVITPLDILTYDKNRDDKWLSNYNADVKFQSYI